ncbi:MAG: arsenosugar biosynthesis radical SAM (seleno)protein ArsS [Pseudomonadota bacterium]
MRATLPLLEITDFPSIHRTAIETLQVNLGYRCNQRCLHCHVNAGPDRTEMMNQENLDLILHVLTARKIKMLDLTGGAPELHPQFKELVLAATALGIKVIDRCNLTILFEPGHENLAEFLAQNGVEIVASLPCYTLATVDKQRGEGVFDKSIAGIQKLNALGYGKEQDLILNLVYNPSGPTLPPPQASLEVAYKRELFTHFNIVFNQLFTLANMPIQRFGSTLISKGQFKDYMDLLKKNFAAGNLEHVMCKNIMSVDWQGYLFDCDFNQQLGLPLIGNKLHLRDMLNTDFKNHPIKVADHCYGCTAGQGSSCGGAL